MANNRSRATQKPRSRRERATEIDNLICFYFADSEKVSLYKGFCVYLKKYECPWRAFALPLPLNAVEIEAL